MGITPRGGKQQLSFILPQDKCVQTLVGLKSASIWQGCDPLSVDTFTRAGRCSRCVEMQTQMVWSTDLARCMIFRVLYDCIYHCSEFPMSDVRLFVMIPILFNMTPRCGFGVPTWAA